MTNQEFGYWYDDSKLSRYIYQQARRHANNQDDISDFMQEAWARVFVLTSGCSVEAMEREAYRGIHAAYERERRHREHEIPFSRMGGNNANM